MKLCFMANYFRLLLVVIKGRTYILNQSTNIPGRIESELLGDMVIV
jgi:hypothetical protein